MKIKNLRGLAITQLSKNQQLKINGGMDWKGRKGSCNVIVDIYTPGAFKFARAQAEACGGDMADYLKYDGPSDYQIPSDR